MILEMISSEIGSTSSGIRLLMIDSGIGLNWDSSSSVSSEDSSREPKLLPPPARAVSLISAILSARRDFCVSLLFCSLKIASFFACSLRFSSSSLRSSNAESVSVSGSVSSLPDGVEGLEGLDGSVEGSVSGTGGLVGSGVGSGFL